MRRVLTTRSRTLLSRCQPRRACSSVNNNDAATPSTKDVSNNFDGKIKAPTSGIPKKVPSSDKSSNNSINLDELAKFSAMSDTWWDMKGPFKPLHMMNPTRIRFIRSALCQHFGRNSNCSKPLKGLKILDVGCGGGLLCEPLARLGASVIGIDAIEKNIKIASTHAMKDPLTRSIEYICTTAEELLEEHQNAFDVVVSVEVIEHVADPQSFMQSLSSLTKQEGGVIVSTINRSIRGYLLAIVAAEHLLQWVPKGTHEWSKFVTPDEVALLMDKSGLMLKEMAGMTFNPLTRKWSLSEDTSVNYIAFAAKALPPQQNCSAFT